jgi:hypothetical protein
VIGRITGALSQENGLADLGPTIGAVAADLLGGKLAELAVPLLATTYVVIGEGKARERIELTSSDAINRAFAGRLGALPGVLLLAAEVSFGPIFGVKPKAIQPADQGSESKVSSPSIVGAGRRGA